MKKVKVNNYILKSPKIKKNKTILCMSDIHGKIDFITNIIKVIKNLKIDYILIPGDVVDSLNQENQEEFLNKIIELSKYAKTYIVLGNHDMTIKRSKKTMISKNSYNKFLIYNKLKNVKDLTFIIEDYSTINLDNNITISGLNINKEYYQSKEKKELFDKYIDNLKINKLDNNKFNILLFHTPKPLIRKKKIINNKITNDIDLILCGHNHGGLTPTWIQDLFKNHIGLVGPYHGFIETSAYGIWTNNNKSLLLSNGVTKMSDGAAFKPLHSIVNSILVPEIELIHLKYGKVHELNLTERKNYKI